MSILRLRRWSRAVAIVLLAAAALGLSHRAEDDVACLGALDGIDLQGDATHAVTAGGPLYQQDHCPICHWSRSLRAPRPAPAFAAGQLPSSSPVHFPRHSTELTLALDQAPARAPPSSAL